MTRFSKRSIWKSIVNCPYGVFMVVVTDDFASIAEVKSSILCIVSTEFAGIKHQVSMNEPKPSSKRFTHDMDRSKYEHHNGWLKRIS